MRCYAKCTVRVRRLIAVRHNRNHRQLRLSRAIVAMQLALYQRRHAHDVATVLLEQLLRRRAAKRLVAWRRYAAERQQHYATRGVAERVARLRNATRWFRRWSAFAVQHKVGGDRVHAHAVARSHSHTRPTFHPADCPSQGRHCCRLAPTSTGHACARGLASGATNCCFATNTAQHADTSVL